MTTTTATATADELTAELTAWLETNWDPELTVRGVVGPARSFRLGHPDVAGRVVRQRTVTRRRRTRAAGDHRVWRAGRTRWPGHAARGPDDHRPRHRRATRALPARHRDGTQGLVPAVQRAGRGIRPRRSEHARRARRRRMDRQRSEGVDVGRALVRPRHAAGPHRSRRSEAPGHHLLRVRHAPTRRRGPPVARAHRSRDVQRGLPHRRAGARRRGDRRHQQRLGGGQHHVDVRAQRPRSGGRRWQRLGVAGHRRR